MKVIYPLSANPWHVGHQSVFDEACNMFGKENVTIVLAQNSTKSQNDMNSVKWSIASIHNQIDVIKDKLIANYCQEKKVDYIVRGLRSGYDLDSEMKLLRWNEELSNGTKTIFIPSKQYYDHVSSSALREIVQLSKTPYKDVSNYMSDDVFHRWQNSKDCIPPRNTIFFGRSCCGKSTYIKKNYKGFKIANVDEVIYDFANVDKEEFRNEFLHAIQNSDRLSFIDLVNRLKYKIDFNALFKSAHSFDMPVLGLYWNAIPIEIISQFTLVKLDAPISQRLEYSQNRNESWNYKMCFFDKNYQDPPYYHKLINI